MHKRILLKPTAILAVALLTCCGVSSAYVQAAMINTADSLALQSAELDRATLQHLVERTDVQSQLVAWGVQADQAQAAVANLTDAEVREIARNMEMLPAGGDALGVIVGAALIVFLVLLITDILGYTDVFPFVKRSL